MPRGTKQQNQVGLRVGFMPHRRAQAILKRYFFHKPRTEAQRKKKNEKERKGRPVESAAPEKISQGRLRHICLTIFTAAWKTQQGFPQLPPARRRLQQQLTTN